METENDTFRTQDLALGLECNLPARYAARRSSTSTPHAVPGLRAGPAGRPQLAGLLFIVCLGAGVWQFGQGLYIHAKARLAQYLIADAWSQTLKGGRAIKPWSWADTWPVARIDVPESGAKLYVLAGADGRAIAFGPGHVYGTPLPGRPGNSVIGGHRDTHFAFLRDLKQGDPLTVQREDGVWRRYLVSAMKVVNKSNVGVAYNGGPTRLTLITCWPFDALRAGGPERYVVTATAADTLP